MDVVELTNAKYDKQPHPPLGEEFEWILWCHCINRIEYRFEQNLVYLYAQISDKKVIYVIPYPEFWDGYNILKRTMRSYTSDSTRDYFIWLKKFIINEEVKN